MREMITSKTPWIKEYPANWEQLPLHALLGEHKKKNTDGFEKNLLSLSYGNIIRKDINTNEGLLPESFNGYNIIDVGDIVLRLTDLQNDHRSLRTGLATERGIITSAYVTLRKKVPLSSEYYHYLLHAFDIMKVFYTMGEGIRQSLGYDELATMIIPSPPLPEQQAIVRYLDSKCAAIDEAIERHKKIIEKLDEYKQTQIFKEMSAFPRVIPTKRVFKIYAGATPKSAVKDFWDGSIIWITPADFKTEDHYITQGKRNITQTGYDSCNTTIVPAGSLVVSKRAPIGTVGIAKVPLCTNQGCLSCVLDKDADAEFFYYALIYKNKEMQQLGAGTTFQEISATAFANMKLPYTQIEKQKIVSERLNMLDKKIQSYKEKHEIVISKLEEYRKSIIYHAVTGKIDCRKDEQ